MRYPTYLTILGLAAITLLSGCSAASRSFSKGEQLEAEGRYEEAMYSYADAFLKDPEGGIYRIRFLNAREKAAVRRYKQGVDFFSKGDYGAAYGEFQAAQSLDPTQTRYKQQAELAGRLKDAQAAYREGLEFEKTNKLKDANRAFTRAISLDPENKEFQAALARVLGLRKTRLEGYELNVKSSKPITIKFKDAKLKDVFNIITQLSGINFIFDEAVKDQPVTVFLENGSFQQALDLLTNMFKLGRKTANENTVIIYPNTPEKKKQYEDMQLRTFHLNYMDAKKAVNLIRTMIQVRKVYVNEDSNSVVVRDNADVVDVVERILDANDVPEPEVVLDVEVVEISDKNAQSVGLLLSNYNVQLGAFSPSGKMLANSLAAVTTTTSTGTTTTTTGGGDPTNLVQAFSMKGYGGFVTVPSAQYNLGKTLAKGEVLSNPKIRVKNKEKSKFNVGTRVPITTTTLNGTLSQVNVQYVDVGVKVNAEPTIQLNNEVVIKLSLEVSSILSKESVGGKDSPTTVVTIGTRNLDTVLSLKDGESSIIGGLIQNSNSDSKQKIFLLGDLPLIGPLISNNETSKDKTELILAITPRLVRGVTVPQGTLMSFSSGREDEPSLLKTLGAFDQEPVFEAPKNAAPPPAPAAGSVPVPAQTPAVPPAQAQAQPGSMQPQGGQSLPGQSPVPPPQAQSGQVQQGQSLALPAQPAQTPQQSQPVQPQPGQPQQGQAPVPQQAQPGQSQQGQPPVPQQAQTGRPQQGQPLAPQRGLLQIITPSTALVGQPFDLEIKASEVRDLAQATMVLNYDPIFVEFVAATEGNFMKRDGAKTTFSAIADPSGGTASVSMVRAAGSGGVAGEGTLASIRFRAKKRGLPGFGFRNVAFMGSDAKSITMLPFNTALEIK